MTKYGFAIFFILFVGCVFFTKNVSAPFVLQARGDTTLVVRYTDKEQIIDWIARDSMGLFRVFDSDTMLRR